MKNAFYLKIIRFIIVPFLIIVMGILLYNSVKNDSATTDEGIHILSAYLSLKDKNYSLDPEHPFLGKKISALPLLIIKPKIDYNHNIFTVGQNYSYDSWQETRDAANQFLYSWGNNPEQILFFARLPNIILTLLFAVIFWIIAKKYFGDTAAVLGLIFLVFCPNILAHGRLANTDLWFSFAYFLAIWSYIVYLESWKNNQSKKIKLIIAGLCFGFALSVKFSALTLPIVYGALWLGFYYLNKNKFNFWNFFGKNIADALQILIICFIIAWATYGFSTHIIQFWKGIGLTMGSALGYRPTYILGHFFSHGVWYYFPFVFLVKTTTPVVILFFVSLFYRYFRKVKLSFYELSILIAVFVFFVITLFAKLNLGVRHILPIYPFIYLWIALFIKDILFNFRTYIVYIAAAIFLLWHIISALFIHPSYLAYFNDVSGGPSAGGKYLADSNLDWGQDLKRLRDYLVNNDINDPIKIDYFWSGTEALNYYHINWLPLSSENPNQKGYIAIGVSALQNNSFSWLKKHQPIAKIGYSLYIYYIE